MTVLRALNNSPLVAAETADRVRAVAEQMHYRRDPALSALAAYRWRKAARTGGQVMAFIDCDGTPHSRRVLDGARSEANLLGYRIDDFSLPPTEAGQARLGRVLYHRGIRGLLFGPANEPCRFAGWNWDHFAPVALDALAHDPPLHAVAMDYFHGARSAVEHLKNAGCRRFGLAVRTDLEARTGHRWLGGGLAAAGELAVFRGKLGSVRALRAWAREHRLDGVITIHGDVEAALSSLGVRIIYLNNYGHPPGSLRLVLHAAEIGQEGVRLLHHALLRGELGLPEDPKTITLRGRWATVPD